LYGTTGDCSPWPYRPRHAAPPMMVRALRRVGLALAKTHRVEVAMASSSPPARDSVLDMQVQWLEIVSREPAVYASRRPQLSLIPVPVAAQVGGRPLW
jgi:hypothetical protein